MTDPAETPAADLGGDVASIADEGIAPIAVDPIDTDVAGGVPDTAGDEQAIGVAADAQVDSIERETFYTFTWGGRAVRPARPQTERPQNDRPRGKGKPKGKGKPQAGNTKPQTFAAKPKREKAIDPDNPFAAALAGFKKG